MKSLIIKAAKEAGKLLMRRYNSIKTVKEKDKNSYVSNVDLESDKLIISMIRKKFPNHNIITEESGKLHKKSDYTWYIDPVDGTHNYIRGLPYFGVSIGLEHKKKMIMGAMDMPYLKEFYFAEKGKGAFLNGKRLKVSKNNNLGKSFILTDLALRYDFHNKQKVLRKLKGKVYDVRMLGCAVAAYAYVARGFADAYYTTFTNSWDVAAGALIVEESGGKVTDLKGGKWNAEMGNYVSSNGKIHNAFLKTIK